MVKIQVRFFLAMSIFFVLSANANVNKKTQEILQQYREIYIAALVSEDSKALLTHHAEQTRLMPEANPTIFGRENASLYFEAFFERFEIDQYEKKPLKYIDMGEAIMEVGTFRLKMRNAKGDQRHLSGNYANLWKKTVNDTWVIEADVWNYDQWVDFKEELVFVGVPSVRTALQARVQPENAQTIELEAYQLLNATAVMQGDARAVSYVYAEDALIFPNYDGALQGRPAIYEWWQRHMLELPIFDFIHNRTDKIESFGGYLVQFSSHTAAWRTDNDSGISTGKHLRVWLKDTDGILKAQFSISAYDS